MAYETGMMEMRVKVLKRAADTTETFGKSGQPKYEWLRQAGDHGLWASEKFDKGMKSLRDGAVDAYDIVMFRMRFNAYIDRWCLIQYQGKWFQIQSCNEDYQTNEIQITAKEMANQNVTIVYSPTNSSISGGNESSSEIGG